MSINVNDVTQKILRYTFEINDDVNLHVTINEVVGNKARDYMEALKVARRIPSLDEIDNTFEGVQTLARIKYNQQESISKNKANLPVWLQNAVERTPKRSPKEFLEEAVQDWKSHVSAWLNALQVEAFILAIVGEGELEVKGEKINRGFFTHQYLQGIRVYNVHPSITTEQIPNDYFDNSKINAERQADGKPALFTRNPVIAQEQMLALVDAVKRANPQFGMSLSTFFNDYANHIVEMAFTVSEEVALEYDEDGFHSEPVVGDTHEEDGTANKKVGRKSRTSASPV